MKSAAPRRAAGDARAAVRHALESSGARTPGLTVPITAVVADQRTLFLLHRRAGPRRGWSRASEPIEVGELIGNDYVVRSGLKAGDRIITSGIQKLGNGAPVKPE